jgi:hypothetical protein
VNVTKMLQKFAPPRIRVALLGLSLTACSSVGAGKIAPDQFNYNQAIGKASSEQMLLNLIRLRYRDVPVFLAVNSVLTQYIYSTNASVAASVGTVTSVDTDSLSAGVGARYVERPTITYSPLSGEEFADQLMTPIPGELIFSLMQSGWPMADIMAMSMERLGGLRNPIFKELGTEEGKERFRQFREAAILIIEIGRRDGIELLRGSGPEENEAYLVFASSVEPETAELIGRLRGMLGLSSEIQRFRVTRRRVNLPDGDMAMRVRSLLDLMGLLSGGVEVPSAHFGQQISRPTAAEDTARDLVPLRVCSGPEPPEHTFVRVRYLSQWFWIEAADERSKESFGLLTYLFLMMAPAPTGGGPLLTVPTG